jgi:hypothetical protein
MSNAPTVQQFLEDLEADAEVHFDGGRSNHLWDIGLTLAAIVTSLIAAVVVAADVPRWIRVGVAALPAACTSIQKVVEVRARSNWYFDYAARLRALAVIVESARSPNLEEFAKKRAAIDLGMERAWRQIGRSGIHRKGHSSD